MPPYRRLTGVGRRTVAAVVLGAGVLGTTMLPATATSSHAGVPSHALLAPTEDSAPSPAPGHPWFGPGLDWERDLPDDYAERLGATPSLYTQRVRYPLTADDGDYLADFAKLSARQGAVAVLTLEPQVALEELTEDDAAALGEELADLHHHYDTHFLVRFAPEMNGSWVNWGQQPDRYVTAFRTVSGAVREAAGTAAEMVWAPAYGAGYSFGRASGAVDAAGQRAAAVLDTDGDGTVDDGDDPYAPYYPGDRWVDWVGLSLYHYGDHRAFGNNAAPAPGELRARLDERFGYSVRRQREPFYDRFASPERPMLVETSALYNTAYDRGAAERVLKQRWWRQVLAVPTDHPAIGAISWLELTRPEAEIDDQVADWRATGRPALAAALRADLDASDVQLGPVTGVEGVEDGTSDGTSGDGPGGSESDDTDATGTDLVGDMAGWILWGLGALAGGYLLHRWFARRRSSRT